MIVDLRLAHIRGNAELAEGAVTPHGKPLRIVKVDVNVRVPTRMTPEQNYKETQRNKYSHLYDKSHLAWLDSFSHDGGPPDFMNSNDWDDFQDL